MVHESRLPSVRRCRDLGGAGGRSRPGLGAGGRRKKLAAVVEWQAEWGETADDLRRDHEKRREPIPAHLFRPEIIDGYASWVGAFWELSTERQIAFGVGNIPIGAVHAWAERNLISGDDFASFLGAIRAMDRVYLARVREKREQEAETPPAQRKAKVNVSTRPMSPKLFDALFG